MDRRERIDPGGAAPTVRAVERVVQRGRGQLRLRVSGAAAADGLVHRGAGPSEALLQLRRGVEPLGHGEDRKSTRLNSSHTVISYAVFCLKKKTHKDL